MLFKFLFPALFFTALYFLIKSIGSIIKVYAGPRIEFPAANASHVIKMDHAGAYEIAYKRPSLGGAIPTDCNFVLIRIADQREFPVTVAVNMLGMRKDLSGNRVVPVAAFSIAQPGNYTLRVIEATTFKEGDKLLITARTGSRGFLGIFAILISAIATIAGFILSILAWTKKL